MISSKFEDSALPSGAGSALARGQSGITEIRSAAKVAAAEIAAVERCRGCAIAAEIAEGRQIGAGSGAECIGFLAQLRKPAVRILLQNPAEIIDRLVEISFVARKLQ